MASTKTLGDLRDASLKRCDQYGSTFLGRWETNDIINGQLAELFDIVAKAYKQHQHATATITLVAGTESYNLPADFRQMLGAYYLVGGARRQLAEFQLPELGDSTHPELDVSYGDESMRWRCLGAKLWVTPKPAAAGSLELWYVPQFVPLVDPKLDDGTSNNTAYTSGADALPSWLQVGWEEYVIEGVAARAATKAEDDPSPHIAFQDAKARSITESAAQRNTGSPQRATDAYATLHRGRPRRSWR
jgi:hypothetical protein